jgi:SPP1 gp7 family putative phage head morphogenesis protein
MSEIRKLSQKYQDWYWLGMEREIVKKSITAFDPGTLLKLKNTKDSFALKTEFKDTFIGRMTDSIQADVTSAAVVSKATQIINPGVRTRNASSYKSAALDDEEQHHQQQKHQPHFTWITADDERVCEICGPLDGNMFAVGDPAAPRPVESTHPRCRCELTLEDAEGAVGDIESIEDLIAINESFF